MYTYIFNPDSTKPEFYKELVVQLKAIVEGQRNWVTNLSNASSLIYHGLNTLKLFQEKPVNWAGFYFREKHGNGQHLILGPFQGKVACTKIKFGKGVCGTAASEKTTQVVPNVHEFPGHIACDSSSLSEIVVPLIHPKNGEVIGVLDIDDVGLEAFDAMDKEGLEAAVKVLIEGCDWEDMGL